MHPVRTIALTALLLASASISAQGLMEKASTNPGVNYAATSVTQQQGLWQQAPAPTGFGEINPLFTTQEADLSFFSQYSLYAEGSAPVAKLWLVINGGSTENGNSWSGSRNGVYTIPVQERDPITYGELYPAMRYSGTFNTCTNGTFYANGTKVLALYPSVNASTGEIRSQRNYIYDIATKKSSNYTVNNPDKLFFDLAEDPTSGVIYGFYQLTSDQSYGFGSVNPDNGDVTVINDHVNEPMRGIAISLKGVAYGINSGGWLYKINLQNGACDRIAATRLSTTYNTSAAYNDRDNRILYVTANANAATALNSIDPETGETQTLYTLPNHVTTAALWFPETPADSAPKAVEELTVNFETDALEGPVSFRMPTLGYDELTLSGELSYTVLANGKKVADGTANPGDQVTKTVTLSAPGNYTITVYATNASGDGVKTSLTKYLGPDTPKAPTNLAITTEGKTVTLTWNAPAATGQNGAVIDPSKLTYRITRYPDEKVYETEAGALTWSQEVEEPEVRTLFYYSVCGVSAAGAGDKASTKPFAVGSICPPFSDDFSADPTTVGYTLLNIGGNPSWSLENNYSVGNVPTLHLNNYKNMLGESDTDAWFVLPPAKLEKNKSYEFATTIGFYSASAKGSFELVAASGNDIEALRAGKVILPDSTYEDAYQKNSTWGMTVAADFTPEETGTYYFAVHVTSPLDIANHTYIRYPKIAAPISIYAPEPAADLKAEPDATGKLSVTLSFTAPAKSIGGHELTETSYAEIKRNGETIANVAIDATAFSWTDNSAPHGDNTYSVTTYNSFGSATPVSVDVFVGFSTPLPLEQPSITWGANYGEAKISWNAVVKDINGLTLPNVKYTVLRNFDGMVETVVEELDATTYTDKVVELPATSDFVQYAIYPRNEYGYGAPGYTHTLPVGSPVNFPWEESFADRDITNVIGYEVEKGQGTWDIFPDNYFDGLNSFDGDNGFLGWMGDSESSGIIFTTLLKVPNVDPAVTFRYHTLPYAGNRESSKIEVIVNKGQGWNTVASIPTSVTDTITPTDWVKATVDLTGLQGQDVQIGFRAITNFYLNGFIDDIRMYAQTDNDITRVRLEAPASGIAGEEINLIAKFDNKGSKTATDYKLTLMRNGTPIKEIKGEPVESGADAVITITDELPATTDKVTYYLVADIADDPTDDNVSPAVDVEVILPSYPTPSGLSATRGENSSNVALSWTAADPSLAPTVAVVESFESATTFTTEVEGWKMIDADELPVGGISGFDIPGVVMGETKLAYMVFGLDKGLPEGTFAAATGSKYLASFFPDDQQTTKCNDDWLISPELCGRAQTVSMMCRSYHPGYLESFEILYSTTGTEVSDFIKVGSYENIDYTWREYKAALPEGAKYVAVRCTSLNRFLFFVDDIKYSPLDGEKQTLNLIGYNVYRDGIKITDKPVTTTSWTDESATGESHTYHVTAEYEQGESPASNSAQVDIYSGIELITEDYNADANYYNIQGMRIANPLSGRIYIRVADGKAAKVMIR